MKISLIYLNILRGLYIEDDMFPRPPGSWPGWQSHSCCACSWTSGYTQPCPSCFPSCSSPARNPAIMLWISPGWLQPHLCHAIVHLLSAIAHRQDTVVQTWAAGGGSVVGGVQWLESKVLTIPITLPKLYTFNQVLLTVPLYMSPFVYKNLCMNLVGSLHVW